MTAQAESSLVVMLCSAGGCVAGGCVAGGCVAGAADFAGIGCCPGCG